MRGPFENVTISIEEVLLLINFIEQSTATPKNPRNYDKISKLGVLPLYDDLRRFVDEYNHYQDLKNFDPYEDHNSHE